MSSMLVNQQHIKYGVFKQKIQISTQKARLGVDQLMKMLWEFPGGLVVRIPGFHCHGLSSVPGWGSEIPQTAWDAVTTDS